MRENFKTVKKKSINSLNKLCAHEFELIKV